MHPKCMGCRKSWTREFMVDNLPQTWINGKFKKRQENVMVEMEKSLLPATQDDVRRTLEARQLKVTIKEMKQRKSDLLKEVERIKQRLHETEGYLWRLTSENTYISENRYIPQTISVVIHGACPHQNCKGFIGDGWACKLCDTKVCSNCRMEKVVNHHVCKPEDVESAKLIHKDSKPCPKCAALCHKVDGCSQVFCINCKTAFNFKTLVIEEGYIHAPDYYRWVRENGGALARNPMDVPCGGRRGVNIYMLGHKLDELQVSNKKRNLVYQIHRIMSHVRTVELPSYHTDNIQDNVDIRVQYMLNEIDEAKWKRLLQQRNKAREKKLEIHAVLDTFITVATDLFEKILASSTKQEVKDVCEEFTQLQTYVNTRLSKISHMFSCVVPYISETWDGVNTKR